MNGTASAWKKLLRAADRLGRRPVWRLEQSGTLIALIGLTLIFVLLSSNFRQPSNLLLIVTQAAPMALVAIGQTLVMLTGGIDLSVSSVVALTGLAAASLMKYGLGPIPPLDGPWSYVAIAAGLAMGVLIGGAQGWLIANRRMPPFIVTLGTMVGLKGIALSMSAGSSINSLPDNFKWMADGQLGMISAQVLIMLGLYALAWYLLRTTKFGRYCYAIGGNETATRLSGVNVDRYKTAVYALSGLLSALAGMILIAYIDGAVYTNGEGYELNSIAAAIIGGTSLSGGTGGVLGTLIGVLIIQVVPNGMVMLYAPSEWKDIVTGVVILIAVLIDVERRRARQAIPKVTVEYSAAAGPYLAQVLSRLSSSIEEHLGCPYCRVYMVDRETNDLVPQAPSSANDDVIAAGGSAALSRDNIVREARESGVYVLVRELARESERRVAPADSSVQSALAMPLAVRNRVVGVLEVQSQVPDAFRDEAIEMLHDLGKQTALMLEDAWLLESGWLMRQTRDVLRHLWDDLYLGRSALAEWASPPQELPAEHNPAARGESLRNLLVGAMQSLHPVGGDARDPGRTGRGTRILELTYLEDHSVDEISKELHISRRQYFYDLKQALEALTGALVRDRQSKIQPTPAQPRQPLAKVASNAGLR